MREAEKVREAEVSSEWNRRWIACYPEPLSAVRLRNCATAQIQSHADVIPRTPIRRATFRDSLQLRHSLGYQIITAVHCSGVGYLLRTDWIDWVNAAQTEAELEALRKSVNRRRPYRSVDGRTRIANARWELLFTRAPDLEER